MAVLHRGVKSILHLEDQMEVTAVADDRLSFVLLTMK